MKTLKQIWNLTREKVLSTIKAYGIGFLITIILSDLLDEVIIPGLLFYLGYPVLSITALVGDIDWITYPLYLIVAGRLKRGIAEQVQRNLLDEHQRGVLT